MAKLIRFNGSLTAKVNGFGYVMWADTAIAKGGKQYFEINVSNPNQQVTGGLAYKPHGLSKVSYYQMTGIATVHNVSAGSVSWVSVYFNDAGPPTAGRSTPASCVMGIAIDYRNNLIEFYKNGKLIHSASSEINGNNVLGMELTPFVSGNTNSASGTLVFNFGESAFMYQLPSGYTSVYQAMNGHELYLASQEVWGMKSSVLEKLSDDFLSLTDAEKETLFVSTNNEKASAYDLSGLGKFKIINYNQSKGQTLGKITAIPKNQLVLPKRLMPIDSFKGINKAKLNATFGSMQKVINMRFNKNGVNDLSDNTWTNIGVDFNELGKFGGKAAKISTITYLESPDSPKWNFPQNDFTISLWMKPNNINQNGALIAQRNYGGHFCPAQIGLGPTGLFLQISSTLGSWDVLSQIPYNFSNGVWYHIALVSCNNIFTLYVDGQSVYSCTSARISVESTDTMRIGNSGAGGLYGVDCYVDDIVVVNKALWTASFTPPTDYLVKNVPFCKLLITTDKRIYQTYDFATESWQTVDHTNLADVENQGIDAAQLSNIPRTAWDTFLKGKSGIGFAYLLSMEDTTDTCNIDKLELLVEMKGEWSKTDIK